MKKKRNKYQIGMRLAVLSVLLFFTFFSFWIEITF